MRSSKDVLNDANPNTLPNECQRAKLGTVLSLGSCMVKGAVSSDELTLPDNQKAVQILSAYATAGTSAGKKYPAADSLDDGYCSVSPAGNILFNSADAVTAAEVCYLPLEGDLISDTVTVASNEGTLLGSRSSAQLVSVEATVGSSTGDKTIVSRGETPSAGEAALNDAGTEVVFAGADAVTKATISYIAMPNVGTQADSVVVSLLDETSPV